MFAKFFSRFKKSTPTTPTQDMPSHAPEKTSACNANEGECDSAGGCGCGKKEDECCGGGCEEKK